jgi:hypothetical protein
VTYNSPYSRGPAGMRGYLDGADSDTSTSIDAEG